MMAGVQQTLNLRAFWKSSPGLQWQKVETRQFATKIVCIDCFQTILFSFLYPAT